MRDLALRNKFNNFVQGADGPSATPSLTFTVPAGTVFKGHLSIFAETNSTNAHPVFGLVLNGSYCFMISCQGGTSTTSNRYSATSYVELPAGSYTTNWLGGYLTGSSNIVALVGNTYKI